MAECLTDGDTTPLLVSNKNRGSKTSYLGGARTRRKSTTATKKNDGNGPGGGPPVSPLSRLTRH